MDVESVPKETGVQVLGLLKGWRSGRLKQAVLERVDEDDCNWHFDGCEISNAWDVIGWMPLQPLPHPPKKDS